MNLNLLEYIKTKPVVTTATIKKKLSCSTGYASLVLNRLQRKRVIKKITKNKYTAIDEIYIVASNIYTPAYISFMSASQFLGYTEQTLNTIQIVTTSPKRTLTFEGNKLRFIPLPKKYFFGYKKIETEKGTIFIAENEKLVIDCILRPHESGGLDEIIKTIRNSEIKKEKIIKYLKATGNVSLIKRAGYLLEKYKGMDISDKFKIEDTNYAALLRPADLAGKTSTKWRLKI